MMTEAEQEPCLESSETSALGKLPVDIGTDYSFKRQIVWKNVVGFVVLHLLALYGLYLGLTGKCFKTWTYSFLLGLTSGVGTTIGAHRYYAHRSYKATFTFRLIMVVLHTVVGQNCLYIWVRDHRQHHKYSDTDADPHNAHRGFFFAHMGWLMGRKHPAVIQKGKTIDMSDLEADWLVMFQNKYYTPLYIIFAIGIPMAIPIYFWNETYLNAFFISYMLRYVIVLHVTWSVNSFAHIYGSRPIDGGILPTDSLWTSIVTMGEGWHNYHHTYPWDYRAAEFGATFCPTTHIIDFMAYLGLAYDLKSAPYPVVKKRAVRTGDGSHFIFHSKTAGGDSYKKVEEKLASETDNEES